MTDFMEIITGRRSVRQYADKAVPEELLQQVLEAGRWAQSWANTQCWEVIVVRDPSVKAGLMQAIPKGNPSIRCIEGAPVLLALCGQRERSGYYRGAAPTKFGDWLLFDLGVLTQNIALAAHALGLGSVVLGLFDHDSAKEILKVPAGYELVTLMPLGYPGGETKAPPRRAVSEFSHENAF